MPWVNSHSSPKRYEGAPWTLQPSRWARGTSLRQNFRQTFASRLTQWKRGQEAPKNSRKAARLAYDIDDFLGRARSAKEDADYPDIIDEVDEKLAKYFGTLQVRSLTEDEQKDTAKEIHGLELLPRESEEDPPGC